MRSELDKKLGIFDHKNSLFIGLADKGNQHGKEAFPLELVIVHLDGGFNLKKDSQQVVQLKYKRHLRVKVQTVDIQLLITPHIPQRPVHARTLTR